MTKTVLFIDSKVEDYQTLLTGLDSDVDVHLLNAQEDGVLQMARFLENRTDLDSIQILSHGSNGVLFLGSGVLNSNNIDRYTNALKHIGLALSKTGDILLYGCDVAQDDVGLSFINQLGILTGADIAASDNLTGKGGDWLLEVTTGNIETAVLSEPAYQHILTPGSWLVNTVYGTEASESLTGTDENDYINGYGGNDILYGLNSGYYDALDGGTGADTMIGGLGDDKYYVDDIGDVVIESSTLVTELDTIESSVNYTLPNNVEILNLESDSNGFSIPTISNDKALNGFGNQLNNSIYGNVAANIIKGYDGNDTLHAYEGNDTLYGGTGNDTLYGDRFINLVEPGKDLDIAVYSGNSKDYQIKAIAYYDEAYNWFRLNSNNTKSISFTKSISLTSDIPVTYYLQIKDTNLANGNDGVDELYAIEKLQFSDVTLDARSFIPKAPNTTPFILELAGGQFKDTNNNGSYEATGTIYIGRKDGIAQMLKVDGTVEYTDKTITVNGIVYSMIGAAVVKDKPLFQGKFTLDVATGKTTFFQEGTHLANEYTAAGMAVDFSSVTMNANNLALGAHIHLFDFIPNYQFSDPNALLISQNNVQIQSTDKASLPTVKDFKLFNFLPVKEFSDFSIQYIALEDKIKIQGKLVVGSLIKTTVPTPSITFNLADGKLAEGTLGKDNYIEIQNGNVDVKGVLTVKDIQLPGGWGIDEATLSIDTAAKTIEGGLKMKIPLGIDAVGNLRSIDVIGKIGFLLPLSPLTIDKASVGVDNLTNGVLIPAGLPGMFLEKLVGTVNHIASSDTKPTDYTGTIGLIEGKPIPIAFNNDWLGIHINRDVYVMKTEIEATVSSEKLTGKGTLSMIAKEFIEAKNVELTIDWTKKFLEVKGAISIFTGAITGQVDFKADSNFNFSISNAAVAFLVPDAIPIIGGAQVASGHLVASFSNDNNFNNDFVAVWGTTDIQKLGVDMSFVVGFKTYFNGTIETIGSKNIPQVPASASAKISSFAANSLVTSSSSAGFNIAANTQKIFLSANWSNSVLTNTPIQVTMPNGVVVNEANFVSHNIGIISELSNDRHKTLVVLNPQQGIWHINVVNSTNLGTVKYTASTDSILPTIEVTAPAIDVNGGTVTISYKAFDSDSNAKVALFYDTNNQGFNGIQIANGLLETDGSRNFVWDTKGIPTGSYFIYAMIMDENNPPVFDYSQGRVNVTEKADLSVTQTVSSNSIIVGGNLTYTVTIKNSGISTAQNITLVETLPEGATFVSSSLLPTQQTGNILTFNLSSLAKDATKAFDIIVTAPQTPNSITATTNVNSATFDSDTSNNTNNITTTVNTKFEYNGHTYFLSHSATWTDAQAEAQTLGGNLVTINNQAEQDWLASTFSNNQNLWIGLTDQKTEGVFKWISGETATYTNWGVGEPNDTQGVGGEDYVHLGAISNQWNDLPNSLEGYTPMQGIIEVINQIPTTGNDVLTGTTSNDILDGFAGADTLIGGLGNDTYYVDNSADIVTETSTLATEIDKINSSVSYTLGANIENLSLTGTAVINATGNTLKNVLVGNAAANILKGGTDNDTLTGGMGKDIFQLTDFSKDTITDFLVSDDTIQLENAVFTKLTTMGILNTAYFVIGAVALDTNDYLIYNKTNGALIYDVDGSGANNPVQIATLGINLALTNADFVVI